MKKVLTIVFFLAIVSYFTIPVIGARASTFENSDSLSVKAEVRSNRENIFEADIVELPLVSDKVVEVLLGAYDDTSGLVSIDIDHCEEGEVIILHKRVRKAEGAIEEAFRKDKQTRCQGGAAYVHDKVDFFDIKDGSVVIDYKVEVMGSLPRTIMVGSIRPVVKLSQWSNYLFIDETFLLNPTSVHQGEGVVDDLFFSTMVAIPYVLDGQSGIVQVEVISSSGVTRETQEFKVNNGGHSIDFKQDKYNLDIGTKIYLAYQVGKYSFSTSYEVVKPFSQDVLISKEFVSFNIELNDIDWFLNESPYSLFGELIYNRGGKSIELNQNWEPAIGGDLFGHYQLQMSYNGYSHVYIQTFLRKNLNGL